MLSKHKVSVLRMSLTFPGTYSNSVSEDPFEIRDAEERARARLHCRGVRIDLKLWQCGRISSEGTRLLVSLPTQLSVHPRLSWAVDWVPAYILVQGIGEATCMNAHAPLPLRSLAGRTLEKQ